MNIKPGMLCYLVSGGMPLECDQEILGRVVTVVRPVPFRPRVWFVAAEWLAEYCESNETPVVHENNLRPIHDPDANLTENHDEELTV